MCRVLTTLGRLLFHLYYLPRATRPPTYGSGLGFHANITPLIGGPTSDLTQVDDEGDDAMRKWTAPRVVEISVGMEINCYACATL